jgi:gamma-glutamyltranspeptidase / glutathione hydrolase
VIQRGPAVAVRFALAVAHPFAGNIGGGGFMLSRLANERTTFIDFREKAAMVNATRRPLINNQNSTKA